MIRFLASTFLLYIGLIPICGGINSSLCAQEVTEAGQKLNFKVETLLSGLHNPSAICVRPGSTGDKAEIFISESGKFRVVKISVGNPKELHEVITGFPEGSFGDNPRYAAGPLGLAFINRSSLVVGGGGAKLGDQLVRLYKLPSDGKPIQADASKQSVGPVKPGRYSKTGEGKFYNIALSEQKRDVLYVTSSGDATKGWVLRTKVKGGRLYNLTPSIKTFEATKVENPGGITLAPKKNWLVVGQMGAFDKPKDSLLTFYNPATHSLQLSLTTGLYDISSLAYSRATSKQASMLYALDTAKMKIEEGGLFRLDSKSPNTAKNSEVDAMQQGYDCNAVKLVSLEYPTAMTFTKEGVLYVTLLGKSNNANSDSTLNEPTGKLIRISGDFSYTWKEEDTEESTKKKAESQNTNVPSIDADEDNDPFS